MAIQFVAEAHASNSATAAATLSVNKPTGTIVGDVMVAFSGSSIGLGWAPPAGWTQIGSTALAGTDVDCKAWVKVATAAEAASYSWAGTSDNPVVQIATFRGVDGVTQVDANAVDTTNTTQNVTGPSVTGVAARGLVLYHRTVRGTTNSTQTVTSNAGKPTASQAEMHISVPVNVVLGLFYNTVLTGAGSQSGTQLNYSVAAPTGQLSRTIILRAAGGALDGGAYNINQQAVNRPSYW